MSLTLLAVILLLLIGLALGGRIVTGARCHGPAVGRTAIVLDAGHGIGPGGPVTQLAPATVGIAAPESPDDSSERQIVYQQPALADLADATTPTTARFFDGFTPGRLPRVIPTINLVAVRAMLNQGAEVLPSLGAVAFFDDPAPVLPRRNPLGHGFRRGQLLGWGDDTPVVPWPGSDGNT
jgi:hypothetical protein